MKNKTITSGIILGLVALSLACVPFTITREAPQTAMKTPAAPATAAPQPTATIAQLQSAPPVEGKTVEEAVSKKSIGVQYKKDSLPESMLMQQLRLPNKKISILFPVEPNFRLVLREATLELFLNNTAKPQFPGTIIIDPYYEGFILSQQQPDGSLVTTIAANQGPQSLTYAFLTAYFVHLGKPLENAQIQAASWMYAGYQLPYLQSQLDPLELFSGKKPLKQKEYAKILALFTGGKTYFMPFFAIAGVDNETIRHIEELEKAQDILTNLSPIY